MKKNKRDDSSSTCDEGLGAHKITKKKNYAVTNVNNYTFSDIAKYFNKPISQAAISLKVSQTYLKRLCRHYDIHRWPYRKLCCMQRKIDAMTAIIKGSQGRASSAAREEIERLQKEMVIIMESGYSSLDTRPESFTLNEELKENMEEEDSSSTEPIKSSDSPSSSMHLTKFGEKSENEQKIYLKTNVATDIPRTNFLPSTLQIVPTYNPELYYSYAINTENEFPSINSYSSPLGLKLDVEWLQQVVNSNTNLEIM